MVFTRAFDFINSENMSSIKKIASISWKYTEERANEIVRGFLPASSESAYTIAWNFWISDLATKCTWQRLTNHAYLIKESIAAQEIKGLAV